MAMNRIQFQPGLSLPEFLRYYRTQAQCAATLEQVRWPTGFQCPHCGGSTCSQAKTGLSTLALKRHLGVSYPTAWLVHYKLMQAMAERGTHYVLDGQIQVDGAYLGGERSGGKSGRGSENKIPFVAAVSLSDEGRPLRTKLIPVSGFSLSEIGQWARTHLASGSTVFSDGLACFAAVTTADCTHQPTIVDGRKPRDLPEFRWINTVLGNLKTSLNGRYHAFNFRKYATRYLAAFSYRFNRRFDLRTLHTRLLVAATTCAPQPLRMIRFVTNFRYAT